MKYSALIVGALAGLAHATFELENTRKSPIAGASGVSADGDSLCLFENDNDSMCFEMTPDLLKIGWYWTQEFDTTPSADPPQVKYYTLQMWPTAITKGNLALTLFLEHLIALQLDLDLAEFNASMI